MKFAAVVAEKVHRCSFGDNQMILKCVEGPMDGAVYVLSRNTSEPEERSTNRKPDGLWFDGQDEHGRNVQYQYKFDRNSEHGTHLALAYKYDGAVVETGIDFETDPAPFSQPNTNPKSGMGILKH